MLQTYAKIQYISICTYDSENRIRNELAIWTSIKRLLCHMVSAVQWMNGKPATMIEWKLDGARSCAG